MFVRMPDVLGNNRSVVYSNKEFHAFFVPLYGFIKDRKLSARYEKTGAKMIACILRHINSTVDRSSPMKLNIIYRSQDIGVPNDDTIWLKKTQIQVNTMELYAL